MYHFYQFEWHFTVRGPPDTAFEGGYYHGRLSFPSEYPMKPPSIILYTPNGRFATNRMICLSISGFHPETWQPSWSIRTALLALIAFMPTQSHGAVGSLECSDERRRLLARKSRTWRCEACGLIKDLLIKPKDNTNDQQERPSTSRVGGINSTDNCDETKFNSSQGVESDSVKDSENSASDKRDSSTDSDKEESSNCNIKSNCSDVGVKQKESKGTTTISRSQEPVSSLNDSQVSSLPQHLSNRNQRVGERNLLVRYPPLVIKSVFVLLSLLILRRIVMVIQS